jgi:lipopolysaccharide heptosyltransferase II
MKTGTQLWIDKHLIGFLARLLNILVIPLGKILRIDHSLRKDFKVIAICKYKGMGSIIQSTPLIKTLRENYPNAKIIFISTLANRSILNEIKEVDEYILLNDSSIFNLIIGFFPFIYKLGKRKIEIYIDLEVYSNFSTLVTILSKSRNRMGFYLNSKSYRMGNYTHMMYYNTRSAISETYLQFARLLECKNLSREITKLESDVSEVNTIKGKDISLLEEKYIAINANASELRIERRWDADRFIELTGMLLENFPEYSILFIGSSSEAHYVDTIVEKIPDTMKVHSLAGKTNIKSLIGIIKNARLFITNDSGPMHIGFSLGAPVLALFGPCSPGQYGVNSYGEVVYANLYCSPCIHEFVSPPCKGYNLCMKVIESEEVFKSAKRILKGQPRLNKELPPMMFNLNKINKGFTIGTFSRAGQ